MTLEKINNEKYLITLSKEDVCALDLSFEKLTSTKISGNKIKQIVKNLFVRSDLKKFFQGFKHKFSLDLSLKDGEYLIFISKNFAGNFKCQKFFTVKEETVPYIFKFVTLEDVINLAKKLNEKSFNSRNSLVKSNGNYYVIIYFKKISLQKSERILLTEHSIFVGKGWVLAAKILEFGKTIISANAISTICKFF